MKTRLTNCLWMAMILQRDGHITYDKCAHMGISLRTYRRYIAALKEAGMILEQRYREPKGRRNIGQSPVPGTFFVAFDPELAF